MKICMITRPPLKEITKKFPTRRHYLLQRMKLMGHEVESFAIHPPRIPNTYLAYGSGITLSPFRFRHRKPDLLLADDLESGLAAALISTIFKIPFVFDFIDDYSLIANYEGRRLRYHVLKFLERVIPVRAHFVIVVTPQIKKFCLDLGIPDKKLRVIPNGVDAEQFKPKSDDDATRKRFNVKDNKAVLFLGKINRYYNLEFVLKAIPYVLKDFPHTKFLFVGDGDYLNHLKELSHRLKIEEAVIFTGFLPPEEIPNIINLCDICVFSLPNDGALVIFEYMACAKPSVLPAGGGTKKTGISRQIIPDDCALKVENSPEGFAQGIHFLLKNKEFGERMGRLAREKVVSFHDWGMLAEEYEKTLTEFLHSSPKTG